MQNSPVASLFHCGNSTDDFVFTRAAGPAPVTPSPVPVTPSPVPVTVDDAFNSLGNATLTRTAATGLFANDALNGAALTEFDAVSTEGGTVVVNEDGSFTYNPVLGFTGTDTFSSLATP